MSGRVPRHPCRVNWDGLATLAGLGAMLLLVIALGRAQGRRLPPEEFQRRMQASDERRQRALESGALVKLFAITVTLMLLGSIVFGLLRR